MNARVSHQVTEEGVLLVLRPMIGAPSSLRVSEEEAKRFAFALLGDLEPEGAYGSADGVLSCGAISVDLDNQDVIVADRRVHFTNQEFHLLGVLARRPGVVISRDALFSNLYAGRDDVDIKILDVLICKIRNKLKPGQAERQIETVWGRGYRIVASPTIDAFAPHYGSKGPPNPIQLAIVGRLRQGPALFAELWAAAPMAAESSIRNSVTTLVSRGDVERTGEPKRAIYRWVGADLPAPSVYALPDTLATGRVG